MEVKTHDTIISPFHIKAEDDEKIEETASVYYVIASNGIFRCRNHKFFKSCVKVDNPPAELGEQNTYLKLGFPKISKSDMELVISFFLAIAESCDGEAGVLLYWDEKEQKVLVYCPTQKSNGLSLKYDFPLDLDPKRYSIFGTIHSHVDIEAHHSGTDDKDEEFFPGVHIIVGRVRSKKPHITAMAVADGQRFDIEDTDYVIEGYDDDNKNVEIVPQGWIDNVEQVQPLYRSNWGRGGSWIENGGTSYSYIPNDTPINIPANAPLGKAKRKQKGYKDWGCIPEDVKNSRRWAGNWDKEDEDSVFMDTIFGDDGNLGGWDDSPSISDIISGGASGGDSSDDSD
jgi:hypothetical protein